MSLPGVGRIWIVISRATSDCHSEAAPYTIATPPLVTAARNVMMATTAASALPAIESFGTMVASPLACSRWVGSRRAKPKRLRRPSIAGSIIDMDATVMEHQATRVVLVHQGDIMGRDDDRGAGFVEFDEQPQQPLRQPRIDVSGRLVGEQNLRPCDHRAGDGGALLLAAREYRRQRPHTIAEADPAEQFGDLVVIGLLLAAEHLQRQGDIVERRQVIEQAEVLEHDAD